MANESEIQEWTILHFSQSNPEGPDQGNVSALLRRVADSIDSLGPVMVEDIILQVGANGGGT